MYERCPECSRIAKNWISQSSHGRSCCPSTVRLPYDGVEGHASVAELGTIQRKVIHNARRGQLPEHLAGLPEYLEKLFYGTAGEPMTSFYIGVVFGQLAAAARQ
jgi:hypothetical protein